MSWQLAVVVVVVIAAGFYLVRQTVRTWTGRKAGCGGGCGCGKPTVPTSEPNSTFIPADQLTLRKRL